MGEGCGGRREEILRHALELFARKGYAATSVREIAESAAVNKPTIYYYFKGKREIYLEILRKGLEDLRATLRVPDHAVVMAGQGLKHTIEAMIGFYRGNRALCRILAEAVRYGDPNVRELAVECLRLAEGTVKQCIERGIESSEFRPLDSSMAALTVVGSVASQIAWAGVPGAEATAGTRSPEEVLEGLPDHFVALFSSGG